SVTSEEAADLLRRMDREDASEVQELLGYPEDTAGGIMTTHYISVPDWATVNLVIAALRARARLAVAGQEDPLPEGLMEIYVVAPDGTSPSPMAARANGKSRISRPGVSRSRTTTAPLVRPELDLETEGRLVGKVSLRDLLLADVEALLGDLARPLPHV